MQVYEPSDDSFLLREAILKENLVDKKCLDMGTGSGFLAIAMNEAGSKNICCVDINYKALFVAQQNTKEIKNCVRFIESNLFDSLKGEIFDFIVFNPPYLPSDDIKWKDLDGGKKGRIIIDKFLSQFLGHLSSNGTCLLLISSFNNKNEIISNLKKNKLFVEIILSKKLFFEELFVLRITRKENIGLEEVDF